MFYTESWKRGLLYERNISTPQGIVFLILKMLREFKFKLRRQAIRSTPLVSKIESKFWVSYDCKVGVMTCYFSMIQSRSWSKPSPNASIATCNSTLCESFICISNSLLVRRWKDDIIGSDVCFKNLSCVNFEEKDERQRCSTKCAKNL